MSAETTKTWGDRIRAVQKNLGEIAHEAASYAHCDDPSAWRDMKHIHATEANDELEGFGVSNEGTNEGCISPEERAADLADQVQALAFTAWGRQDAEHREAAEKLGRKMVRLLREAENQGLERAAMLMEVKAGGCKKMPAARQRFLNMASDIRLLKRPDRHFRSLVKEAE